MTSFRSPTFCILVAFSVNSSSSFRSFSFSLINTSGAGTTLEAAVTPLSATWD